MLGKDSGKYLQECMVAKSFATPKNYEERSEYVEDMWIVEFVDCPGYVGNAPDAAE